MSKAFTPGEYQAWLIEQPKKMIVVKAFIRSTQGNILIAKPTFKNTWQLPGGAVNARESPEHALQREIQEELGIEISESECKLVGTLHKSEDDILFILYELNYPLSEDTSFELPADEIETYEFVNPTQLSERLPAYYHSFLKRQSFDR